MNMPILFQDGAWKVRVALINGAPWFVVKDVCKVLGLGNSNQATVSLDSDEKANVIINDTSSNGTTQRRTMVAVSESGLYALIFKSRKPEAKSFRKWITQVVIPQIRKTGSYGIGRLEQLEEGQRRLLARIEQQIAINEIYLAQIDRDAAHVGLGKLFTRDPNCIDIGEAARIIRQAYGLRIGAGRLFGMLRQDGLIRKRGTAPTQAGIERGLRLEIRKYKGGMSYQTTVVTRVRGLATILRTVDRRRRQQVLPTTMINEQFSLEV